MKAYEDMNELSFHELVERVQFFNEKASDAFFEGDNEKASYCLVAAERFANELKLRVILTAM